MKAIEKAKEIKQITKEYISEFYNESLDFLKEVNIKSKDLLKTNYDLGIFHLANGNLGDAKLRFKIVNMVNNLYNDNSYHLARCYQYEMKPEKVIDLLSSLDSNPKIAYRLKLIKNKIIEDIPIEIIEEDYDFKSTTYDKLAKIIDYQAPFLLFSEINEILKNQNIEQNEFRLLDLGCGTGFCGAVFKEELNITYAEGIDISSQMINLASLRYCVDDNKGKAYDKLIHKNFLSFNEEDTKIDKKFDFIIACNSLHYNKDLKSLFLNLKKMLRPGGYIGFVVQKTELDSISFNYGMGNFCFNEQYIKNLLNDLKFDILKIVSISSSNKEDSLCCVTRCN